MVALVAAALLPAFAVGAISVRAALGSYRQAFDDRLEGTARALASAVNTEIGSYILALSTLATARSLDEGGNLGLFHQRAQQIAARLGTRIFVVAPDLSLLLHTSFPAGTVFPEGRRRESVNLAQRVFETSRPAVGNLLRGQVTGRQVAAIYVPVFRDGRVVLALGLAVEPGRISAMLAEQTFREGGYASLVDGQGQIMARSSEPERSVGQTVRDWMTDAARNREADILQGTNRSGVEIITALQQVSGAPGWFVIVAEPLSTYYTSLWKPLATLAFGALGSLGLALSAAIWIGGRILGPVGWLTSTAERVAASGGAAEFMREGPPVRVQEFERLRVAVLQAHMAMKADQARKTLLMRELDHRAKNVLAVVQSVLRLSPRDEPRAFVAAVEARIAALGRTQSLLAQGGWSGADLRVVVEQEVAPYIQGQGQAPRLSSALIDGPQVALAATAVQPLAMVLHELATNAAKHGALSTPGGTVEIRWSAGRRIGEDGLLHLRWAEAGGPPIISTPSGRGFGSRVIEATVRGQLGGSVVRRWERTGLICEVTLPLERIVADAEAFPPISIAAAA
ncbi:sensor histidine kinase [Siccirubricoccus deserti]|nr:sensor histidine kinase [Siccirubricoccus deserti]